VVASGADKSCNSWPLCGSGSALDFGGVNAFTMLHRGAVLLIGLLLVYTLLSAFAKPGLRGVAAATLTVFAVQVVVGAAAAISPVAIFDGLHVALATLVWAGVLATALLTLPRADRSQEFTRLAVEKRPA
jgi:heme A synthase